jgi:hypothetical protein
MLPSDDIEAKPAASKAVTELNDAINEKEVKVDPENSTKYMTSEERDWRFYMVFVSLSVTGLLAAVEGTVISTALPTIVDDLGITSDYAWIANAYFLTW